MQKIEYNNKSGYFYEYFRPGVTSDVLIYQKATNTSALFCKRTQEPYKDFYCLPGGFLENNESCLQAAIRELKEETGLITQEENLTFLHYYDLLEDPRGQSLNMFFYCSSHVFDGQKIVLGEENSEYRWITLDEADSLKIIPHHRKMFKLFCGAK